MTSRKYPSRPWVSAHAIIFDENNQVLLTKRAAPPKRHYWFPPGGAIDLGETVESGLIREILEETAIEIQNLRVLDYIDAITRDKEGKIMFHYVVFIFTANFLRGTVYAQDDALEAKWVSLEDIINNKIPIPEELIHLIKKIDFQAM